MMDQLEEQGLADDIYLMSYSHREVQGKIDKIRKYGKKIEFKRNEEKRGVMGEILREIEV